MPDKFSCFLKLNDDFIEEHKAINSEFLPLKQPIFDLRLVKFGGIKEKRKKHTWCSVSQVVNLHNYTWRNDSSFILQEWPPDKSRDPKEYINLKNFIVMDFAACGIGIAQFMFVTQFRDIIRTEMSQKFNI